MTPDARILLALRGTDRALAVSELAERVELTPGELAVRIDGLVVAGYGVELVPHIGYRLTATPDRIIADDLIARLARLALESEASGAAPGAMIGREILVFQETSSTNDVATRMAREGAGEGLTIFAEQQTAGRGRLGRRWASAAHEGLWFSIVLRPSQVGLEAGDWSRLTTWAAVGVARALEAALPGVRAAIKWPNDLYLNGRKAVGILIESVADTATGGFAVVGIGVNVNQMEFPTELADRATSLRLNQGQQGKLGSEPLDRQAVAVLLLRHLDALYSQIGSDFATIVAEAERRSVLVGRWVEIQTGCGVLRGEAMGLQPDGSLRIRGEDGVITSISGGEVSVAKW